MSLLRSKDPGSVISCFDLQTPGVCVGGRGIVVDESVAGKRLPDETIDDGVLRESGYRLGRGEALREVQLTMIKEKRHPFFWANFIQSGEWANLDGKR